MVKRTHLMTLIDQITRAAETPRFVLMGDFNLNVERKDDPSYSRRKLTNEFTAAVTATGFKYLETPTTFHSYGRFLDGHVQRHSTLDHCYVVGVNAAVKLLPNATTDHQPLLLVVDPCRVSGTSSSNNSIECRNFKAIGVTNLEVALDSTWDWGAIHQILDVNEAHAFVVDGITAALDVIAPMKSIRVKKDKKLYLSAEALGVMKERDEARCGPDVTRYRDLRNKATRLVRRDKLRSNISTLSKASGDPRVLWQLANAALGKPRATLPQFLTDPDSGAKTVDDKSSADLMAGFYIKKVEDLRETIKNAPAAPTPDWPPAAAQGQTFSFSFASAGKVSKTIKGLKSTEALGVDRIPVSVLKKGVALLAAPLAHLVNRSLATGVAP
jgi:hypothetical protein